MDLVKTIAETVMAEGQKRSTGMPLWFDQLNLERAIYAAMTKYTETQKAEPTTPELKKSLHTL
jgi:hypothetical protein